MVFFKQWLSGESENDEVYDGQDRKQKFVIILECVILKNQHALIFVFNYALIKVAVYSAIM